MPHFQTQPYWIHGSKGTHTFRKAPAGGWAKHPKHWSWSSQVRIYISYINDIDITCTYIIYNVYLYTYIYINMVHEWYVSQSLSFHSCKTSCWTLEFPPRHQHGEPSWAASQIHKVRRCRGRLQVVHHVPWPINLWPSAVEPVFFGMPRTSNICNISNVVIDSYVCIL
jgi:hypothetical protein